MTLELQATPGEVMRAVESLQRFGEERDVPSGILFGLTVALEECGSNVVNHALKRDAERTFTVDLGYTGDAITIELRDSGPPFDPTQMPAREPTEDDDGLPPGGWGIQLMRRYTDAITYFREGGENVLRLSKGIDKRSTDA